MLCCCFVSHLVLLLRYSIGSCARSLVFLAEHRGSAHGPPRHSTAISTAFHGQPRTLHGLPRTLHGLPRTFHGLPRNAAACSGTPWRPMTLAHGQFPRQSPRQSPRQPTSSIHGRPRQAVVQRKDPRQCLRHGGGHGICRGSCRGASVGCHGWYHGSCRGQNGGTCNGHNRDTCRGSATYNRKPWPLPWNPPDFHGSPWQGPRKTTEVPRSLPRTATSRSNNVHPCVPGLSTGSAVESWWQTLALACR